MKSYREYVEPGKPVQLMIGGRIIYVQRAPGLSLTVELISGVKKHAVERVGKGFKAAPTNGFDQIRIETTEAGWVEFVVTDGDIQMAFDDDKSVDVVNSEATAIPVVRKRFGEVVDFNPATVGTGRVLLVSDSTLQRLCVRNGHASAVLVIGGALVTMANAVIRLLPGDVWIEEDAASADWYAVSDTAATLVQVQGLR